LWLRDTGSSPTRLPAGVHLGLLVGLVLLLVQAASGAWVSTNYAVLACAEFPQCQGSWWPAMDFSQGFALWRPLGFTPSGEHISFQALTSIHMAHRLLAGVTLLTLGALVTVLWRQSPANSTVGGASRWLAGLLVLQALTGISNAVLDWPLLAAVLHTGGAAALMAVMVWLLTITRAQPAAERAPVLSRRLTE
jgi:heme a synthase